jgi:hypothetical protein
MAALLLYSSARGIESLIVPHRPERKNDSRILEKARKAALDFEVVLVQPGASIASVTDDALRLVATTELYLVKTTQAKVRFVLSA